MTEQGTITEKICNQKEHLVRSCRMVNALDIIIAKQFTLIQGGHAMNNDRCERERSIAEVFQDLGLGTAEERRRFQRLADLGTIGQSLEKETHRQEPTDTQNNTAKDDDA